eukprot:scaffold1780_cov90-Skeletonema_dohrnii-CCMP3373.AAC.7
MSTESNNEAIDVKMMSCASCGKSEVDEVKLKECDDCDLVRYCSDECQENHAIQHEEHCKKRAAELRDELLFRQPDSSYLGDCPICCLPLSLDPTKSTMYNCCSKVICIGCAYTNQMREIERKLSFKCPFCREPAPTKLERDKRRMKRIEVNDPVALCREGIEQYGEGNYERSFEYMMKAAELGDVEAHYKLSLLYYSGQGVEEDMGKKIHHLEEAAIGGHPYARYTLGCDEWNNNNNAERAVKHWIIGATQGGDDSINNLMFAFKQGHVSKDDLAAALRAHQVAVDATKSPQREAVEEFVRSRTRVE